MTDELDRRMKVAELDAYLAALATELGPISAQEAAAARALADRILGEGHADSGVTPVR